MKWRIFNREHGYMIGTFECSHVIEAIELCGSMGAYHAGSPRNALRWERVEDEPSESAIGGAQ